MSNKNLLISVIVIVALAAGFLLSGIGRAPVGGTIYNRVIEFSEGITVDGTTRIGGTGAGSFTTLSGTTGTFTGAITGATTLTMTGETNLDTLVQGGDVYSYSTGTSFTLTAAQVCNSSVISITPSTAINVTLPSTTTLAADCLPTAGDSKTFLFENAATGATSTTIVAGTAITLLGVSTTSDIVAQNGWVEITITNVRSVEFSAVIHPFIDAD